MTEWISTSGRTVNLAAQCAPIDGLEAWPKDDVRECCDYMIAHWQLLRVRYAGKDAETKSYEWLLGGLQALIEDGYGLQLVATLLAIFQRLGVSAMAVGNGVATFMERELFQVRERRTTDLIWGECPTATGQRHDGAPCRRCGLRPEA